MNGQETIMRDRKHNEKIIDHTPAIPYTSPLDRFIETNCKKCPAFQGRCRVEDSRGLTPMSLCVHLYIHETTSQGIEAFAKGLVKTAEISEKTLTEDPCDGEFEVATEEENPT
jgi:hypothetical protein